MGARTKSTAPTSPPTRRVLDVLETLAAAPEGATSSELAQRCAISTSTCALILTELADRMYVARREDRKYVLGSGLFGVVHGLRRQYPLLDLGRRALEQLCAATGGACSLTKIGTDTLTVLDLCGHVADEHYAIGQQFPVQVPFGLVAMAWRDPAAVDRWLRASTPRLSDSEVVEYRKVLSDIRDRGYGAWRFDDAQQPLRERLATVLDSADHTTDIGSIAHKLSMMLTQVSLQSITSNLETRLPQAEFIVLPIFGPDGDPEYQIEIRLTPSAHADLTLPALESALSEAVTNLTGHRRVRRAIDAPNSSDAQSV